MRNKKLPDLDFNRALARGHVCYNARVGAWWESQAADGAHRRAYRQLADYVRQSAFGRAPGAPLLVDYGCGSGAFLAELARRLPRARLVGLDGSHKMLARAAARLAAAGVTCELLPAERAFAERGARVRLVQTRLPNFRLPPGRADAVSFIFPNIAPAASEQPMYDRHGYRNRDDTAVATLLARFREMDPEDDVTSDDPETLYHGLLTDRVLARNIRGLLRPRGWWFKADYANAPRIELGQISQWRSLFAEGALADALKGRHCQAFFALRDNRYHRSQVILDVYHQTRDPADQTGGYFVTLFAVR